ncbi:MAG TPA: 50S ribosomal protein L3 N(5)-glutamine methyltransferase [Gammaproteobacteria bacterium]|nr:50S ribosomal protein L3 N(5)-glutamine methyltransferase [Gammaproteobacteria bacterium]
MLESENALNELFSVRDFVRYGVTQFNGEGLYFGHGTDNALDESTALVLYALHLPHDMPGHFMDAMLLETEKSDILDLFNRRIKERTPVAYLTREAWFAGHKFYVDNRVLVPRSPIAELINSQFSPWIEPENVVSILDLCTGSACIAIALAYAFPDADVDAVDISQEALEVATINVDQHHLTEQVELIQSDLFENLAGRKYDLIVSNPPYVDADEMASLPDEYRQEPALGLASGVDGLDAIRIILQQAADFLNPDGILVAEVGASEEALQEAYPAAPFMWFDFEQGGGGVFMLTRDQLMQLRDF